MENWVPVRGHDEYDPYLSTVKDGFFRSVDARGPGLRNSGAWLSGDALVPMAQSIYDHESSGVHRLAAHRIGRLGNGGIVRIPCLQSGLVEICEWNVDFCIWPTGIACWRPIGISAIILILS